MEAPSRLALDALALLGSMRDIVTERVATSAPPAWCEARGWTDFLRGLDDAELERCESEGLSVRLAALPHAPPALQEHGREVERITRLPRIEREAPARSIGPLRTVGARKRAQLDALLGAVGTMASRATRIVDVGAGRGHFTRVAADRFAKAALGLDRDPDRVATATALGAAGAPSRFAVLDACREDLGLLPDDLAVGLHACGELGDRLVSAAAVAGCDLALVSCCLQKVGGAERPALSASARAAGLDLPREVLGLSNVTAARAGVEVPLAATMEARQARYALRLLLAARGVDAAPGEEMRGVNRRRARRGLPELAARAFEARGLPAPTDAEIRAYEAEALRSFGDVRRFSLPRSMLGRLVEVAVALDRAAALGEAGRHVRVATIADPEVTPRNVALFASESPARLPRAS